MRITAKLNMRIGRRKQRHCTPTPQKPSRLMKHSATTELHLKEAYKKARETLAGGTAIGANES